MKFYRHGDVNLHQISKKEHAEVVKNGKTIYSGNSFAMAEGEVTNSKHYLTTETPSGITVREFGEKRYIEIESPSKASHTHDHATIDVDPGYYVQIPERELDNWSLLVRQVKD